MTDGPASDPTAFGHGAVPDRPGGAVGASGDAETRPPMNDRLTIRVSDPLESAFEHAVAASPVRSRSEALRLLMARFIAAHGDPSEYAETATHPLWEAAPESRRAVGVGPAATDGGERR